MSLTIDPSEFYYELQTYKTKSNTLLNDFFIDIEDFFDFSDESKINVQNLSGNLDISYNCSNPSIITTCNNSNLLKYIVFSDESKIINLESSYKALKDKIELLRNKIRIQTTDLNDNINNKRNNEHFATTLNSDYSEIYKYKYLRNWGIFFSILGGAYLLKKIN